MKSLIVAAAVLCSVAAAAQALEFEVASVKINTTGGTQIRLGFPPGSGRVDIVNVPVRAVIQAAYSIPAYQLDNVPAWAATTRIDIVAKADPASSVQQLREMLQPLLVERLKLKFHHESRERDVYALVVASKDGKLGPGLQHAEGNCAALASTPRNAVQPAAPGQQPVCGIIPSGAGHMVVKGLAMSGFVQLLSAATAALGNRQVVDQTGLTGGYDITLTYTPEALSSAANAQRGSVLPLGAGVDPDGPNLFQAVQDQLGLKLESRKLPLDVMVIDQIETPTPD